MKRKVSAGGEEAPLPPKRPRLGSPSLVEKLSEELCFHFLSYLDHADLLAVSETSRYLNRLASDNQVGSSPVKEYTHITDPLAQLWKALYARQYLSESRQDAWSRREDGLPTRTWKGLFRIAHNWRVGRARTTRLSLRSSVLPDISLPADLEDLDADQSASTAHATPSLAQRYKLQQEKQKKTKGAEHVKVVWHGQHYFVASEDLLEGGLPSVEIFEISPSSVRPAKVASIVSSGLKGKGAPGSLSITEMQLDAAESDGRKGIRLAVFYSNGQFSIFRIFGTGPDSQADLLFSEEHFSSQTSSRPIVMARLHTPILATTSSDCSIRFRHLEEVRDPSSDFPSLRVSVSPPTMRTSLCFAPMTMRLTRKDPHLTGFARLKAQHNPQHFQLSLAYSTPYYPSAFTVGLQVFHVTVPRRSKTSPSRTLPLDIFTRSAIAVPPSSLASNESNQAMVNTLEHDGPYIVASRSNNTISVYKVIDALSDTWFSSLDGASGTSPALSPAKMHSIPLKLRHVRTLFGHTAAVDAVSVLNGRCVSTGRDGIKVWELPLKTPARPTFVASIEAEEDDEDWRNNIPIMERDAPVLTSLSSALTPDAQGKCRWIGLDTSRIVTVSQDDEAQERHIKVYHFD